MRNLSITFLLAGLIASATISAAQQTKTTTNAPTRRAERPPPILSPEILPGGGVTFRFQAPKANEVKVSGQFAPETVLTKDDHGLWSATVPAVPAGVHEYHFVVDGLNVIDPQNSALKPQRWPGSLRRSGRGAPRVARPPTTRASIRP